MYPHVLLRKCMWVKSRNCGCLVTWFCYQLIAKPGNKTAAVPWPDPYGMELDAALRIVYSFKSIHLICNNPNLSFTLSNNSYRSLKMITALISQETYWQACSTEVRLDGQLDSYPDIDLTLKKTPDLQKYVKSICWAQLHLLGCRALKFYLTKFISYNGPIPYNDVA